MSRSIKAAALVIGNELLTGKVQDQNVATLARRLFELGISLDRVVICGDLIETIVADLNNLRATFDYVFTSGGVGPTHDDVTVAAVARAFDRPIVHSAEIDQLLRDHFGQRLRDGHLRMARVPEGATLMRSGASQWPTVCVENVVILPGLPQIFRRKVESLHEMLSGGSPFLSRSVQTTSDEGEIAPLLDQLVHDHPMVTVGSYPRWGQGPIRVTVTVDGRDAEAVDLAIEALLQALPSDQIVADQIVADPRLDGAE